MQGHCSQDLSPASTVLKELSGMGILTQTSLHGRFTIHRLLFLSPSTTSSGFKCSLVIHSCTILFILWLEIISPDPLSLWETRGQSPRNWGNGLPQPHTNCSNTNCSKAKVKIEVVSISPKRMTLEITAILPAPWAFWRGLRGWHCPSQQWCIATATATATATLQARESKEKPSLSPWGQIWLEK